MNNQDFKKLLRENIEARKEKEIEEGKIGDFFNKIMSGVKGSEKSSPLDVTANYIKNRLIDGYKKTGQDEKAEDSNLIDQLTKRFLASAKTTIEDSPNVNSKDLIKTLKNMVDAVTGLKDEEDSEDPDSEDPSETPPSGDGEVDDPNADAADDFLDPKVNASSISKDIIDWVGSQIRVLTGDKTGKDAKKESIKFIQNLDIILKKQDPEAFNQYLLDTFKQHRTRGATKTRSGGSGSWIVNHPGNLKRLSLDNFKKIMEKLSKDPKLSIYFKIIGSLPMKESKKNTLQPRLHESHQKERDEEIYNKLMKRLNNQ